MNFHWLNFHVDYACRHSGACCTSGWPIPVECNRAAAIQALVDRGATAARGRAWLVLAVGAPEDVAGTLALTRDGHCVFHGSAGCAVHPARPISCAHFPYVCLIDPRGVHVTLSHYCPTAASMLFEHAGPIAIVAGPPPVPGFDPPEGLDARSSLPPLESPNRLMTFEALTDWERQAVSAPWAGASGGADDPGVRLRLFERARRAVPAPIDWPAPPPDYERVWTALVEPAWAGFAPVLARYRAAKLFASWALYLGDGIPAAIRLADIALAVLQVEAARRCAADGGALDAARLKEAIRQTDLLLVHYAEPAGLV